LVTFASAVLFGAMTAAAQTAPGSAPGSMQQQQPSAQPGMSQSPSTMSPMDQDGMMATKGQASSADKVFVKNALEGGMAEVQLGKLALQKSSNDDVKQFAQRMVDDHTKMGDQMKPIAEKIGVAIPDAPSKKDQATMAKLEMLNGDAFDKAYMKDMVKDHKTDLSDFKTEAANASDPAVKNAASSGAQVIAQHLQMAERINQKETAIASNGGTK